MLGWASSGRSPTFLVLKYLRHKRGKPFGKAPLGFDNHEPCVKVNTVLVTGILVSYDRRHMWLGSRRADIKVMGSCRKGTLDSRPRPKEVSSSWISKSRRACLGRLQLTSRCFADGSDANTLARVLVELGDRRLGLRGREGSPLIRERHRMRCLTRSRFTGSKRICSHARGEQ
jgi:hypothetical protein